MLRRQQIPRLIQRQTQTSSTIASSIMRNGAFVFGSGHAPIAPSSKTAFGTCHQHRLIGTKLRPQTFAGMTPAQRTVERKLLRRLTFERPLALAARQMQTVSMLDPLRLVLCRHPRPQRESCPCQDPVRLRWNRRCDSAVLRIHRNPIHHTAMPMMLCVDDQSPVRHRCVRRAIDADSSKPVGSQSIPDLSECASNDPPQSVPATAAFAPASSFMHAVDDLIGRLLHRRQHDTSGSTFAPCRSEQNSQIVVNFRHRADGRTRR